ncbi:site-specific DNA-methyltransferase, partial [Bacteroides ovatus]
MSNTTIFDSRYTKLKTIDWNFQDVSQDALANIHPYPARFIPDIPRELISALGCAKGSVVLDPFCGSGTTLVEAQRAGFDAVGIDLNPIACLISSVKTQPLP